MWNVALQNWVLNCCFQLQRMNQFCKEFVSWKRWWYFRSFVLSFYRSFVLSFFRSTLRIIMKWRKFDSVKRRKKKIFHKQMASMTLLNASNEVNFWFFKKFDTLTKICIANASTKCWFCVCHVAKCHKASHTRIGKYRSVTVSPKVWLTFILAYKSNWAFSVQSYICFEVILKALKHVTITQTVKLSDKSNTTHLFVKFSRVELNWISS